MLLPIVACPRRKSPASVASKCQECKDDANIFQTVKNYYNRKLRFRTIVDAKNVAHSAFYAFIHCPTMAIQQEQHSRLTRFEWQFNKNRYAIQQESVGNPYCFAMRRFRHGVGRDVA